MKFLIAFMLLTFGGSFLFPENYSAAAFGLTTVIVFYIISESGNSFVFREWALLLYAVNYLLSPAITYLIDENNISYSMKISSDMYFSLALPGFLLLAFGMYTFPTTIFKPDFSKISKSTLVNEQFLTLLTVLSFFTNQLMKIVPKDFAFFLYLFSLLRFVGAFALFATNARKYIYLILFIMVDEVYTSFNNAMFHDAVMWIIFFSLFYLYIIKPNLSVKLLGAFFLIFFVLLIQIFKVDYRDRVWRGGEVAGFETVSNVVAGSVSGGNMSGVDNLLNTLNRGNQAWIFASTVENMDRTKNFQGLNLVYLYISSALLPRFLAPNKITSGDRAIFSKFAGHEILDGTAMGLGIFADGYIAYGKWGVYIFSYCFGLLFALIFKLVGNWSNISPFYILLVIPMLNYAVRPDCELQTVINHLVKSALFFAVFVNLTKYRFILNSINFNKK